MPGPACHFETADLPHVNESGSGGRVVTGRGCLFALAANAWVQTSLREEPPQLWFLASQLFSSCLRNK